MAATGNKQQVLTSALTHLKKKYGEHSEKDESRTVLEEMLYAMCREGSTREFADPAFDRLRKNYFDWNEVRVSSEEEIAETLDGLPDAMGRAQRIIAILQQIFEESFSFDLESYAKLGVKAAAKRMSQHPGASDFVVAWVTQKAFDGHAIPLDPPTLRVLHRLQIIGEGENDIESIRGTIEHLVPKAKGANFVELFSQLAHEICVEVEPHCSSCPLIKECPTGQARLSEAKASSGEGKKVKPR